MNPKEQIKRELYKSYLILVRNLYQQSQPKLRTTKIGEIRKRFLIGSTTFLAFAMESFINDFGEQYVEDFDDLEKMESLTKYLLFPKVAKDNPAVIIKKSDHSYEALKLLFKYRNSFAHHKPAFRGTTSGEEKLYTELDHEKAKNLYAEMIKIFKAFNNQFHIFKDCDDWIADYSESINTGM